MIASSRDNKIIIRYLSSFVLIILYSSMVTSLPTRSQVKYPVVLVPGDGGSQFEAKLDKPAGRHSWCTLKSDWFPLWLNLELLAPYILDCFVDNIKLIYDREMHKTSNQPGVLIRQSNFGNTSTVEWLDESHLGATSYYSHIVDHLVNDLGYERDVSVRGAPYDFRKTPNEMSEFLENLKALVEGTFRLNGGQKVVLLGHSMGNLYVLYLLNRQTPEWKSQYIQSFISLSGPWGGAVKTLRLLASGDKLGVFIINPLVAREQQRSMPSTAWLMPYDTFWNDTEVLIYGPVGNYTVKDYRKFFDDIDFPDGAMMRDDTEQLVKNMEHPGVETHCLHGVNISTAVAFSYTKSQWYDSQPTDINGNGDGTVNLRSLHGCRRWIGKDPSAEVIHREFANAEHLQILKNPDVIDYIGKVLTT